MDEPHKMRPALLLKLWPQARPMVVPKTLAIMALEGWHSGVMGDEECS
jgi:hypothetical protein